jgi:DNA-binding transcriptional ArsR family regulator
MITNTAPTGNRALTSAPAWVLFAALGDPTREAIVRGLQRGPLPAGRIAAGFKMSRPAVSRHLRVLREAGWVVEDRDGRNRVYRLAQPALVAALRRLNELVRPGAPRADTRPLAAGSAGRLREGGDDWAPWSD